MREILGKMKNIRILEPSLTLRSSLKEDQLGVLEDLADQIAASLK